MSAGFFSATNTVRKILASSGSRDIISRRSSCAGLRVIAAWSFCASFARILRRKKKKDSKMHNACNIQQQNRDVGGQRDANEWVEWVEVPCPGATERLPSGQQADEQVRMSKEWMNLVETLWIYFLELCLLSSKLRRPEPSPSEAH